MPKFYVMISKTTTFLGKCIRIFGACKYNHSAISFDRDLTELYAFARRQRNSMMSAGLIHESTDRYLDKDCEKNKAMVKVFEFDLTEEQIAQIKEKVSELLDNQEYLYNSVSLVTYPFIKGVKTYKAYTCSEFVATCLTEVGFLSGKEPCKYTPEDLIEVLTTYEIFSGSLSDFIRFRTYDERYYAAYRPSTFKRSAVVVATLCKRTVLRRRYTKAS